MGIRDHMKIIMERIQFNDDVAITSAIEPSVIGKILECVARSNEAIATMLNLGLATNDMITRVAGNDEPQEQASHRNSGASDCSATCDSVIWLEAMNIVNQMIALYEKYDGAEFVPPYIFEMREGAYHMLENIPKEYHPDEDVLPIVFWNGGLRDE